MQEPLVFQAVATNTVEPVSFRFDHGDGTLDPRSRSDAYFLAPGQYRVRLEWWTPTFEGALDCGIVTVVNADGCTIGLGPADGIGWWCGDTFCPNHGLGVALAQCPREAPWGCFTSMAGTRQCIDRVPPTLTCLVGTGPADGTAWYCNGVYCDPAAPFAGCPPYPIIGCHPSVAGPVICIDPAPTPTMGCTISATTIAVGQVITLTAIQTGPQIPVDVIFNHGDGTRDPRWVAEAYYAAPGSYLVTLDWNHAGGSGTTVCGTVVVS